jgi:hypothetical protein
MMQLNPILDRLKSIPFSFSVLGFFVETHNTGLRDGMLYFQLQPDGCSGLQFLIFTREFRRRTVITKKFLPIYCLTEQIEEL